MHNQYAPTHAHVLVIPCVGFSFGDVQAKSATPAGSPIWLDSYLTQLIVDDHRKAAKVIVSVMHRGSICQRRSGTKA